MKVLILEDNLFWSARLKQSVAGLGHEPLLRSTFNGEEADVAILNLASPALGSLVPQLQASGIHVIGHAGHKEKELHQLGKQAGCDTLATNGELTHKLDLLLEKTARA